MAEELPKIDRWNSEPLDVHTWSDHPEIKALFKQPYIPGLLASTPLPSTWPTSHKRGWSFYCLHQII